MSPFDTKEMRAIHDVMRAVETHKVLKETEPPLLDFNKISFEYRIIDIDLDKLGPYMLGKSTKGSYFADASSSAVYGQSLVKPSEHARLIPSEEGNCCTCTVS